MGEIVQLYATTALDAGGDQFIGPNGRNEMKGYPTLVKPVDAERDKVSLNDFGKSPKN